jgi:hypothetical protein
LSAAGGRISYRGVRISSGNVNAAGAVDVGPNGELSGRINIEVGTRTTVIARGVVNVVGTTKEPILRP